MSNRLLSTGGPSHSPEDLTVHTTPARQERRQSQMSAGTRQVAAMMKTRQWGCGPREPRPWGENSGPIAPASEVGTQATVAGW